MSPVSEKSMIRRMHLRIPASPWAAAFVEERSLFIRIATGRLAGAGRKVAPTPGPRGTFHGLAAETSSSSGTLELDFRGLAI
ncbi:MAG: hypothetical protein ABFD97_07680 [Syntrophobacter sp.]